MYSAQRALSSSLPPTALNAFIRSIQLTIDSTTFFLHRSRTPNHDERSSEPHRGSRDSESLFSAPLQHSAASSSDMTPSTSVASWAWVTSNINSAIQYPQTSLPRVTSTTEHITCTKRGRNRTSPPSFQQEPSSVLSSPANLQTGSVATARSF
jgi:hypothetical protein